MTLKTNREAIIEAMILEMKLDEKVFVITLLNLSPVS